jgi:hypothetical protein
MADIKITDLPAATGTTPATDVLIIDTGAATKKITVNNLLIGPTITTPVLSGAITGTYTLAIAAWIAFGAAETYWAKQDTVSYRKDPFGFVHLRGALLSTGSAGVTVFTAGSLPSGYQPDQLIHILAAYSAGTAAFITIGTDGSIASPIMYGTDGYHIYLDGITFKAA